MPGRRPRRVERSAGTRPGAWGGYSVRRSGRFVEAAMGAPRCDGLSFVLPGDASEQAEADEEAEGGGEEDGPGVGGETEGGTGTRGGHGGISLDSAVHTKKR